MNCTLVMTYRRRKFEPNMERLATFIEHVQKVRGAHEVIIVHQDGERLTAHVRLASSDQEIKFQSDKWRLPVRFVDTGYTGMFSRSWGLNIGARLATTEAISFVDADDILPTDYIERDMADLSAPTPNPFIVHGVLWGKDGDESLLIDDSLPWKERAKGGTFMVANGEAGPEGHITVRKSLFESVRGFSESMLGWGHEDTDLVKRLVAAGGKRHCPVDVDRTPIHLTHPKEHDDKYPNREGYNKSLTNTTNDESWGDINHPPVQPTTHKYYDVLPDGKFSLNIAALKADVSLFIATPIYGLTPPDFTLSMMRQWNLLNQCGIKNNWHVEKGNSDAALARNLSVADFLKSGFSHLLFVDADHQWYADDILRMLAMDKPVLGMVYARKVIDWEAVKRKAIACQNGLVKAEDIEWAEVGIQCSGMLKHHCQEQDGIIEAHRLAAGGLLIKREVFDIIIKARPDLKWKPGQTDLPEGIEENMYAFFSAGIDRDGVWKGEDFTFCDLCRSLKIPLYADMIARVLHWGSYGYMGNPRSLLANQKH